MTKQCPAAAQDKLLLEQKKYVRLASELLTKRYDHPPLAYVHSFGCQQNMNDGEMCIRDRTYCVKDWTSRRFP